MDKITEIVKAASDFIWGIPLIVLLLFVGVLLTIKLKGLQITKIGKALKYSFCFSNDCGLHNNSL